MVFSARYFEELVCRWIDSDSFVRPEEDWIELDAFFALYWFDMFLCYMYNFMKYPIQLIQGVYWECTPSQRAFYGLYAKGNSVRHFRDYTEPMP